MEESLGSNIESPFTRDLVKFRKVVTLLKEIGFKKSFDENYTDLTEEDIIKQMRDCETRKNEWNTHIEQPLVVEGPDGIRLLYSPEYSEPIPRMRIGFANSFMDRKDSRIVKFIEKLREEGLGELID